MADKRTIVLNAKQIEQKINRIAYEVFENNYDEKEIIIAGIAHSGYLLAERIETVLKKISGIQTSIIKITLNKKSPLESNEKNAAIKNIDGKVVILVDDVLNSGKTLIYGAKLFLHDTVE